MKEIKKISEDFVVAKFLEAEFFSPRFSQPIHSYLQMHSLSEDLILHANIDLVEENNIRKELLNAARGYLDRKPGDVFHGFPNDVAWSLTEFQTSELGSINMSTYPDWLTITRGTRLLKEGADYLMTADPLGDPARFVRDFIANFDAARAYAPIVIVTDDSGSRYSLLEGAVRSISHWLMRDKVKHLVGILGRSANMSQWHDF